MMANGTTPPAGAAGANLASSMSVYGAAASAVGGVITTILAVKEQARQAKALERAAEQEIRAAGMEASEIERIAYQRAYAALFDISLVNAISEANIRRIHQEAARAEGSVIAQTAGAGLALVGSPMLAAAAVAGEEARVTAYTRFKARTQVKRFEFEVVEELRRGEGARAAYEIGAEGIVAARTAEVALMQAQSLRGAVSGFRTTAALMQSPTVQAAISTLFPSQEQTTLTPDRGPGQAPPVLPVVRQTEAPQFPPSNL